LLDFKLLDFTHCRKNYVNEIIILYSEYSHIYMPDNVTGGPYHLVVPFYLL